MVWPRTIATLFSPTLGKDKSEAVVNDALKKLGFPQDDLSPEQATKVLDALASSDGIVGAVGRFVRTRTDFTKVEQVRKATPSQSGLTPRGQTPRPLPRGAPGASFSFEDIVPYFAAVLGKEKSLDLLLATAQKLGIASKSLSFQEAVAVLDELSRDNGVHASAARFAKAKLVIKVGD